MPMVTAGRNAIADLLGGVGTAYNAAAAHLGVGTSTTAWAATQTDLLGTPVRKPVNLAPVITHGTPPVNSVLTYVATFGPSDANFAWNEFGLFRAPSGGSMFSRVVSAQGTKASGQSWELTFAQSISNGDT